MYKATYESIVEGGSVEPGADPRDDKLLAHVRRLERPNLKLVRLEFIGELIWFRGSWMREYPENAGDGDG